MSKYISLKFHKFSQSISNTTKQSLWKWPTLEQFCCSLYMLVVYELVSFAHQHLFPSSPQTTAPGIVATTLTAGDRMWYFPVLHHHPSLIVLVLLGPTWPSPSSSPPETSPSLTDISMTCPRSRLCYHCLPTSQHTPSSRLCMVTTQTSGETQLHLSTTLLSKIGLGKWWIFLKDKRQLDLVGFSRWSITKMGLLSNSRLI